jgi:hypothetical protein
MIVESTATQNAMIDPCIRNHVDRAADSALGRTDVIEARRIMIPPVLGRALKRLLVEIVVVITYIGHVHYPALVDRERRTGTQPRPAQAFYSGRYAAKPFKAGVLDFLDVREVVDVG